MYRLRASQVLLAVLFSSIFLETLLNFSLMRSVFDVVHQISFFQDLILNFFWWNLVNVFLAVIGSCVWFVEKERNLWRRKSKAMLQRVSG